MKSLYVKDGDARVWAISQQQAKDMGRSLSSVVTDALREWNREHATNGRRCPCGVKIDTIAHPLAQLCPEHEHILTDGVTG